MPDVDYDLLASQHGGSALPAALSMGDQSFLSTLSPEKRALVEPLYRLEAQTQSGAYSPQDAPQAPPAAAPAVDYDAMAAQHGGALAQKPVGQVAPGNTWSEKLANAQNMIMGADHTLTGAEGDLGLGFLKGAAHTAIGAGQLVSMIPGVGAAANAIGNAVGSAADLVHGHASAPVSQDQAFGAAKQGTAYTSGMQQLGGLAETGAEMALPVGDAVDALPSAARAGQGFKSVMAVAHDVPVDISGPGGAALRIQQLADRGGSMPMVVRKLLNRITDPEKAPLNYEEARDFASNISRLSADEMGRLTPTVAREVANLRVTMNQAIGDAAQQAGKYDEYRSAMTEYARAMKLRGLIEGAIGGAKKAIPAATATGAAYWLTNKIRDAMGG